MRNHEFTTEEGMVQFLREKYSEGRNIHANQLDVQETAWSEGKSWKRLLDDVSDAVNMEYRRSNKYVIFYSR